MKKPFPQGREPLVQRAFGNSRAVTPSPPAPVAISAPAQLLASAGKDGNLLLWRADAINRTVGYRSLPRNLELVGVLPLDPCRELFLPRNQPPELFNP